MHWVEALWAKWPSALSLGYLGSFGTRIEQDGGLDGYEKWLRDLPLGTLRNFSSWMMYLVTTSKWEKQYVLVLALTSLLGKKLFKKISRLSFGKITSSILLLPITRIPMGLSLGPLRKPEKSVYEMLLMASNFQAGLDNSGLLAVSWEMDPEHTSMWEFKV